MSARPARVSAADLDTLPPEVFLSGYPDEIRALAERFRSVVRRAVPDAIERVRPGWRLIGYDLPVGRRTVYLAFVAPEPIHVHLGFQHGTFMADPDRMLEGAHLRLRKVRFVTLQPGDAVPEAALIELTRQAARLAAMSREQRFALALDLDAGPDEAARGVDHATAGVRRGSPAPFAIEMPRRVVPESTIPAARCTTKSSSEPHGVDPRIGIIRVIAASPASPEDRMRFEGSVPIKASRAAVWAFVMDPEKVGQCGPGVEKIEVVDATHFKAAAKVGIAFISLRFNVDMEFAEVQAPDRAVIKAHGQAPGSAVDATAEMRLSDGPGGPDGTTVMDWHADVNLSGSIASLGARLIEGTAAKMIGQTFDCMRSKLEA